TSAIAKGLKEPGVVAHALVRAGFTLSTINLFLRAPRRFLGKVGNLRPIGNRPAAGIFWAQGETPAQFAACRYVGQVANLRRIVNPPLVGQPILAPAGSLRLAIRPFLPQETFPPGIVCRSCERDIFHCPSGTIPINKADFPDRLTAGVAPHPALPLLLSAAHPA